MRMTVDEFARRWRAKEISAAEVTDECLRRIDADNGRLNAFILVMADTARRRAAEADRELAAGIDRGPLHGVPVSVKDLFDVEGTATTAASRVREGHVAAADASLINRLHHAGAVLIGKTNLHEFAFGTTNEDSAYGPTLNPHDPTRLSGGSSGGSAVSVATGMALATLGTDTGGSIRIPAAACGIVGLKPTFDELPTEGVIPLSRTLDHVGPLTTTVTDAWLTFHALRGRIVTPRFETAALAGRRFGLPRAYFFEMLDEGIREAFDASIRSLRGGGAVVEEVEIPSAPLISAVYLHLVFGDAASYHAGALERVPERYTSNVRLRLELARYVLAEDYVRALRGREVLGREVDAALSGYDALVLPTLPIPAPTVGESLVSIGDRKESVRNVMLRLTQLFNLTGHPAISIPNGKTAGNLPSGLQLVGTHMQTDALLHLARSVEAALQP